MKLKKTLSVLGIFSIISIICISFLTWRFCDDFRFEKTLQTTRVFEFMYNLYMNIDGRFLSFASFVQLSLIKYFNLKFVVFIWSIFFILNSYLIFKIILNEFNNSIKFKAKEIILIISIISISLFYGFYKHISETVYWAVGGTYMLHAFFGLLWIILFRIVRNRPSKWQIVLLYALFTIIVGMMTQNLVVCLIVFLFIESIFILHNGGRNKLPFLGLYMFCLIAGVILTSFSPGSLSRISKYPGSLDKNILNYFKYFFNISKVFLRASVYLVPLSILSATLIYINFNIQNKEQSKQPDNKLIQQLKTFKWLIISVSSIFPFLLAPSTVCYRTALFFMIFLFIFIQIVIIRILSQFEFEFFRKHIKVANIVLVIAFSCHLGYMAYCYKIGNEYQSYMSYIDRYLITQKNSPLEVTVKKKTLRYYPFMFNIKEWSLTDNPGNWINKEWSFYYDIDKIKTE